MSRRHRRNRNNTKHYDQIEKINDQRQESDVKRNHASDNYDFDNHDSDEKKRKIHLVDSVKPSKKEQIERSDVTEDLDELKMQRILNDLEKQMDKEYMMTGKVIAELFRLVYIASLKLPDMELQTDMIDVIKNLKHTTVIIHHAYIENRDDDSHRTRMYSDSFNFIFDEDSDSIGNYDEEDLDDDIDEEGWLYDAD